MKKFGTVVDVLSSRSDPVRIAFSRGLPFARWWPRVAGCFGIGWRFERLCGFAEDVELVVVVDVLTEEVPSDPERVGREAVVELVVVLEVVRVVEPVVVVELGGATVPVVEVVGSALVVLELVVLELVVEVVVVEVPQLSDSVTRERSSAAAWVGYTACSAARRSCCCCCSVAP